MGSMGRKIEIDVPCPVCGTVTFEEIGDFDICPVCGWENSLSQYQDPDYASDPNGVSLNQARAMWAEGKRVWSPED